VADALVAANELKRENVSVEVIDLRTLVPLDTETIVSSVAKTGRLLVVDEDFLSYGMSGEIVARVVEALHPNSIKGIKRHAMPDIPLPAAITLEQAAVPNAISIAQAIRSME
jgi:pyruvate dehydrogenase E1 component beta subunit